MSSPLPTGRRPKGAVRRRFELFALEAWEDSQGRILEVSHGTVAVCHVEPDERQLDAQRTFDEWVDEQIFWNHHLSNADALSENEDTDGLSHPNQW